MSQREILPGVLGVLVLLSVPLSIVGFQMTRYPEDGFVGNAEALFSKLDAVCSPGFSEQALRSLKPGMTTQEVQAVLGPPLWTSEPALQAGEEWWEYCRSSDTAAFRRRWVRFARTSRRVLGVGGQFEPEMEY